jgi:uncharacterized protein YjbK
MAKDQEIELKYAVTEAEYRRLRRRIRNGSTRRFTNHFFDTPDCLLRKRGIGCRLRVVPGRGAVLTVKHGGASRGGLHRRIEIEASVPEALGRRVARGLAPFAALPECAPVRRLLELVGEKELSRLERLGSLTTSRTTFRFKGLTGELDRCLLRGQYFHELEVESSTPKKADLLSRAWLEGAGIPVRPEARTKLGRFFSGLKRHR